MMSGKGRRLKRKTEEKNKAAAASQKKAKTDRRRKVSTSNAPSASSVVDKQAKKQIYGSHDAAVKPIQLDSIHLDTSNLNDYEAEMFESLMKKARHSNTTRKKGSNENAKDDAPTVNK